MQPFQVIYEFANNVAPAHRPAKIEWDTHSVTIWARTPDEARSLCRHRHGASPVSVQSLWVSPQTGEC